MDNQPVIASRQALAAQGRSSPGKVTGKLRKAINAMVWGGMKRNEAAQVAGLQPDSLYVALRRPHVRAEYLAQLEVLRSSERARNIHTWADIRENSGNDMARIKAGQAIEQSSDEYAVRSTQQTPGLVIVVRSHGSSEPKPLIDQDA